MFRAQRLGQPARSAGRDPEGSRRCSSISTTARTSRSTRTRTSAASCSSCSRWASATTRERDVREAARAFTGWTNDVLAFKFDAEQHDFGEKTFLGRTGPLQRRGHHRHHPRSSRSPAEFVAAKLYRYFVREEISDAGEGGAGPHVPRQRLSDEAAAEADLPLEGLLQPAVVRHADQEPGAPGGLDLQEDGARARCRRFPTSAG